MLEVIKNTLAALSLLIARKKCGKKELLVLCFHKIVPCPVEKLHQWAYLDCNNFEAQINYLKKKGCRFLSEDDFVRSLAKKEFPDNSVLITLDDGSYDNYVYAFPILKKYRVPAIIFLATGFIGNDEIFWWDRLEEIICGIQKNMVQFNFKGKEVSVKLDTMAAKREAYKVIDGLIKKNMSDVSDILRILMVSAGYKAVKMRRSAMNWDEVREMEREGVGFGAHTVSHIRLSKVSKEQARKEIKDSKNTIENELKKVVNLFAYPYGGDNDVSPFSSDILRELNFKAGFTTTQGPASFNDDPMLMPRIALSGSETFIVFKAKLFSHYFRAIKMLKKAKKAILCGRK